MTSVFSYLLIIQVELLLYILYYNSYYYIIIHIIILLFILYDIIKIILVKGALEICLFLAVFSVIESGPKKPHKQTWAKFPLDGWIREDGCDAERPRPILRTMDNAKVASIPSKTRPHSIIDANIWGDRPLCGARVSYLIFKAKPSA